MAASFAERTLIYDPVFLEAKRYAVEERFGPILGGEVRLRVRGEDEVEAALRFVYWLAGPPDAWSVSRDAGGELRGVIERRPASSVGPGVSRFSVGFSIAIERGGSVDPMAVRGNWLCAQGTLSFSSGGSLMFARSGAEEWPLPLAEGGAARYARRTPRKRRGRGAQPDLFRRDGSGSRGLGGHRRAGYSRNDGGPRRAGRSGSDGGRRRAGYSGNGGGRRRGRRDGMIQPKYYCEHCGREVKGTAKLCPYCGRFFTSVKCPKCGFTGDSRDFLTGCPVCRYGVPKMSGTENAPSEPARRVKAPTEPLPTWVFVVALIALLIALFLFFLFS